MENNKSLSEFKKLRFSQNVETLFRNSPYKKRNSPSPYSRNYLSKRIKKLIIYDKNLGSQKLLNFNYFNICHKFKKEMKEFDSKQEDMKKKVIYFNNENTRFNSGYRAKSFLSGIINLKQMPTSSVKIIKDFVQKREDKDYNLFSRNALLLNKKDDITNHYKFNFTLKGKNDEAMNFSKKLDSVINEDDAKRNLEKIFENKNKSNKDNYTSFYTENNDFNDLKSYSHHYKKKFFSYLPTLVSLEKNKKAIKNLTDLCSHLDEDIKYFKSIDLKERRKNLLKSMSNSYNDNKEKDFLQEFFEKQKKLTLKDKLNQNTLIFDDKEKERKKEKKNHFYQERFNTLNVEEKKGTTNNVTKYFLTGDVKKRRNDEISIEEKIKKKYLNEIKKIRNSNQVKSVYRDIFRIKSTSDKFRLKNEKGLKLVYQTITTPEKYEKVVKNCDQTNERLNYLDKDLMGGVYYFDD